MPTRVKKERNSDPESEEEDGYVKIRYQQPDLPALEIPTDDNGDLPWKFVQALDPKISGLVIQSKEMRRIMKIKSGVIQEPKKGWKSFKVIALLEESDENAAKAIHSTASSRCDVSGGSMIKVKTEKENVPVKDSAHSVGVSAKLCDPNPTTVLPELASLAKPVKCESNKEHSIPENSSSVHSSVDGNPNLKPKEIDIFAAYNVKTYDELKMLLSTQEGFLPMNWRMGVKYFKNALVVHADKNIFTLLSVIRDSNILYKKLDPAASDICELCQQPLTIGHLLKQQHLIKYDSKFQQEIPEIEILLRPENQHFYLKSVAKKLKVPPGFSTNTQSNQQLFDEYKEAFIHRISQKNLMIPINDPLFLDRFMFIRENFQLYCLPKSLNPNRYNCLLCEKPTRIFHDFIFHTLSINHIRNALSQEDLNWICKLLSFVQKDKNGYKILLPLRKRKTDDDEPSGDTVPKKKFKMI